MKISILGLGHLGGALLRGLLKAGCSAEDVTVYDRSPARFSGLEGVHAVCDAAEAVRASDVCFIVLKSAGFFELAPSLSGETGDGRVFVSFMAGVTLEALREALPGAAVVRAMPSIAIESCEGITAYTKAPEPVAELLGRLGYAFETEPENIEKVMAFASCGIGFAAYLLEAFRGAGLAMGFSEEECGRITAQTFKNALDRGHYAETVRAVATKGGATEQGVLHMDGAGVPGAVSAAVRKAYERML
ncbi:MAG: NAD(P)-binding domain-containing protein [Oscillospiraceae bacterium]|nr:NAD(P)-binding domain-containing protein [Oscillospiraceae bacterium]